MVKERLFDGTALVPNRALFALAATAAFLFDFIGGHAPCQFADGKGTGGLV